MKITDCIQKQKENRLKRKRENIELLKPIVNIFLGSFSNDKADALIKLLDSRIGDSDKVNYSMLDFGAGGESLTIAKVRTLAVSDLKGVAEYNLNGRRALLEKVNSSQELEKVIGDYASEIFNKVARFTYQLKGIIRINILLKAENTQAVALERLIALLKQKFGVLYTEGVYIDVYCLLDQREYSQNQNSDERKSFTYLTLCELNRLAEDDGKINMAFCLSNYDSMDRLMTDSNVTKRILTSMGLMAIVKDGICANSNTVGESYDDTSFKSNSRQYKGNLFSLGYMHLEKIPDAIDYVAYRSVLGRYRESERKINLEAILERMELNEVALNSFSSSVIGRPVANPDILLSMVKDTEVSVSELNYKTRGDILKDVFGNNLILFFEMNNKAGYEKRLEAELGKKLQAMKLVLDNLYRNDHYTVYEISALLKDLAAFLEDYISKNLDKSSVPSGRLDEWTNGKEKIVGKIDTVRETKEPVVFYRMAQDYLHIKLEELQYEVYSKLLDYLKDKIENWSGYYENLVTMLDSAIDELDDGLIEILEGELELQGGNCRDYYSNRVNYILDKNRNGYKDFIQKLNEDICAGLYKEDAYFNRMIAYCNDNILTDECFDDDFSVEMLKRLKDYKQIHTDEDVYNMAYNTILDNQTYFINFIATGAINNEICFFVNTKSRFVDNKNSRIQDLRARNKIKIFYEDHFDGVDILFIEGCFGVDKIHGYTAMEQAFERLGG